AQAHEDLTQSKLRDWCHARFLSYLRMREWRELHRQLLVIAEEQKWGQSHFSSARLPDLQATAAKNDSDPIFPYEAIHRCLLSGWPTQVGRKDERSQFLGTRERKFQIFPGSALAKHPPPWLLAGQILDLQKVYAMTCACVEPEWIEQQAAHLIKKSWREP